MLMAKSRAELEPVPFTPPRTKVAIEGLKMAFGEYVAVCDVNLSVGDGEFLAIVGPTGCGKSTILNAIAGLLMPSDGSVTIGGAPVAGVQRKIGYLFQQEALMPWKTALENVEIGLTFRKVPPTERRNQARAWLEKVGLRGMEARYPHELSGGQRKRVQMAQALITRPEVILMDEPFSALDIHTRHLMQSELLDLWQEDRRAVVMITHDLEEAISLADRVCVLSAGPESSVVGDFKVTLDRPRDVSEIKLDPAFTELYRDIWSTLKHEVEKSHAYAK